MKKVDLTQVSFLDVEGKEVKIEVARQLGNFMYMQGRNIAENELGSKVYHSADPLKGFNVNSKEPRPDCSIEINDDEEKILLDYVAQQYSYVIVAAVKKALKPVEQ